MNWFVLFLHDVLDVFLISFHEVLNEVFSDDSVFFADGVTVLSSDSRPDASASVGQVNVDDVEDVVDGLSAARSIARSFA